MPTGVIGHTGQHGSVTEKYGAEKRYGGKCVIFKIKITKLEVCSI